jgi:hypothetical protein
MQVQTSQHAQNHELSLEHLLIDTSLVYHILFIILIITRWTLLVATENTNGLVRNYMIDIKFLKLWHCLMKGQNQGNENIKKKLEMLHAKYSSLFAT